MTPYRLTKPPRALRRPGMQLDNIALVPASLLPYKKEWQAIANRMPRGSILISANSTNGRLKPMLERVATILKAKGHLVTTLPSEQFC